MILEIERVTGRLGAAARGRADGAAPLIGSSAAIRAVRDRIERVAATDFTVLIEGAMGPPPHSGFIDFFDKASLS
jgi:DNA-binding NtrC family response regulator